MQKEMLQMAIWPMTVLGTRGEFSQRARCTGTSFSPQPRSRNTGSDHLLPGPMMAIPWDE